MKVIKKETFSGIDIIFISDNKFYISFGGNLDLYWTILSNKESNSHSFIITKEYYEVYKLFEQLFSDIKNINLFDIIHIPLYCETDEEIKNYLKEEEKYQEERKKLYRMNNDSNYNELYNEKTNTITWYSDETSSKVSNYLKINKINDYFKINFYIQKHIEGYDRDFNSPKYITIRFRNSGSRYDPFNYFFMKMYNELIKIDFNNYQMHIEEYLYNKVKKISKR